MTDDREATAARVFAALADPTRRSIMAELAARGSATATDLADRLPISRQGVAKHLDRLTEAGLTTTESGEGRRIRYRVNTAPMELARQFLAAMARDWDTRLDHLKNHLE